MGDFEFFKALREKLTIKPKPGFDDQFWSRFEDEFKSKEVRLKPRRSWLRLLVGPAVAVAVVFVLQGSPLFRRFHPVAEAPKEIPFEKMIEHAALIEDLNLFMGESAEMAKIDLSSLSDEEWKLLLEGNG